ncbi:hypothetical protein R3P38DRAFT_3373564 [Favolaschia claudopus]|uniref:Uncharacterized protein n=1 Tax=Favolaschia claudopus TaxID=2862362 RepID=A0AAV9ZSW0_9AGAR
MTDSSSVGSRRVRARNTYHATEEDMRYKARLVVVDAVGAGAGSSLAAGWSGSRVPLRRKRRLGCYSHTLIQSLSFNSARSRRGVLGLCISGRLSNIYPLRRENVYQSMGIVIILDVGYCNGLNSISLARYTDHGTSLIFGAWTASWDRLVFGIDWRRWREKDGKLVPRIVNAVHLSPNPNPSTTVNLQLVHFLGWLYSEVQFKADRSTLSLNLFNS